MGDWGKPKPPRPPTVRYATLAIWAKDAQTGAAIQNAQVDLFEAEFPAPEEGRTNGDGYFALQVTHGLHHVEVHADGYGSLIKTVDVTGNHDETFALVSAAPSPRPRPSLAQLAQIRGSMWTTHLKLPLGIRPNQDTNILAMDYYEQYGPDDRKRMIDRYKALGYTHAVTGPVVDGGYHGLYAANTDTSQAYWDRYLDAMQEWRDADIIPVHFQKPDGWTLDQLKASMEHLYAQDRAKDLLPILVPPGWEPTRYGWSSRTWGTFFDWASSINPDALILGHTETDVDAMKGTDAVYNDEPETNDKAWVYLAPKMHGWLIQLGGYVSLAGQPSEAELDVWRANLREYFLDAARRFRHGYAGWPTGSKFGPDVPLKLYYGEGGAYKFFWDGATPEALVRSFGDIAMAAGADGYLDGGSVVVP